MATFMPPGGLSGKPYATLLGAPIIETEWNSTLGTVGDILLVDLSQYCTITKGGMENMSSMHLYFDSDQQAFRVTYRIDGQPWFASALTPYQGTNTQSSFVALATRT
jgi:HK97 family phage major capsid protein